MNLVTFAEKRKTKHTVAAWEGAFAPLSVRGSAPPTCLPLHATKHFWFLLCQHNRGHPCLGLAAIFTGMLCNVQIIQKSSTRNIVHVSIIVLELPPVGVLSTKVYLGTCRWNGSQNQPLGKTMTPYSVQKLV